MIHAVIFDCLGVLCSEHGKRHEDVVEFVRELHKHHKTALLSNINRQFIDILFTQQELAELFDVVVLSSEVGIAKPNELIYEITAMKLGAVPEECVMIDDSEANVAGARQAGMQALLYETLEQCRIEIKELTEKNDA
jgi:HAD superfamily hydrolase (TIGR01509 family)